MNGLTKEFQLTGWAGNQVGELKVIYLDIDCPGRVIIQADLIGANDLAAWNDLIARLLAERRRIAESLGKQTVQEQHEPFAAEAITIVCGIEQSRSRDETFTWLEALADADLAAVECLIANSVPVYYDKEGTRYGGSV